MLDQEDAATMRGSGQIIQPAHRSEEQDSRVVGLEIRSASLPAQSNGIV